MRVRYSSRTGKGASNTYQFCDNQANTRLAGQREDTLFHDLCATFLIGVFHRDNHLCLFRITDEIHGTSESLYLAGQHPVCEITVGTDLHGAEDREVDSASADHAEGFFGAKDGGTREEGDGFFAGVD